MRCKVGDLAFYIGPIAEIRGWIFRVVRPDPRFEGAWITEPRSPVGHPNSTWDKNLQPIGTPGDFAVDETLLRNPVPIREGQEA